MKKLLFFRLLVILLFFWCVMLPLFWAYGMSKELSVSYAFMFKMYLPETMFGVFCLFILPMLWMRKKWALYALWIGAISVPFLEFFISKLTYGPWLITLFLLSFLTWVFYLLNRMQI